MPLYDFECVACEETFEKIVTKYDSEQDPVTVECPKCGGTCRTTLPTGSRHGVTFHFNYMAP